MKRTLTGVLAAAGTLALTGGMLAVTALPAAAVTVSNDAYAAAAFGLINRGPLAEAQFPGTSPVTARFLFIQDLLTTGPVRDTAGPTSASSIVIGVQATQLGHLGLTATAVSSSCSRTQSSGVAGISAGPGSGQVRAATFIFGGRIDGVSGPEMLPFRPAPNTRIAIPGGIVLWLNKQFRAKDGTLAVAAIFASLRGGAEHLAVGVSRCSAMDLTPSPSSTQLAGRS
jgi:hypothetical protein